ncbi:MAG: TIGR01777 family oxidoreductase [Methylovulum sp.]|nr:TIGR01777 family oxidoreductase [Methylovulum sp.]
MNILITGGTGFIGSALTRKLSAQGHAVSVLSRKPESVAKLCGPDTQALGNLNELMPEDSYPVVINLAGAPIFDGRWNASRKQLIRSSRIQLTEQLLEWMANSEVKPELLISGSAIGYYGDQGDTLLTEQSAGADDFAAELCKDWEQATIRAAELGTRVCLIRTGLVLAGDGGLLQRMRLPFQLGLGGRLGSGQQWMSWIHRDDWIAIALAMIDTPSMQGAYNATAPHPVTNSEFTQTLAHSLKRPALLPVPTGLLKLLLGEMSGLVLGSQRVIPERLLEQGFQFRYPLLDNALDEALAANH